MFEIRVFRKQQVPCFCDVHLHPVHEISLKNIELCSAT